MQVQSPLTHTHTVGPPDSSRFDHPGASTPTAGPTSTCPGARPLPLLPSVSHYATAPGAGRWLGGESSLYEAAAGPAVIFLPICVLFWNQNGLPPCGCSAHFVFINTRARTLTHIWYGLQDSVALELLLCLAGSMPTLTVEGGALLNSVVVDAMDYVYRKQLLLQTFFAAASAELDVRLAQLVLAIFLQIFMEPHAARAALENFNDDLMLESDANHHVPPLPNEMAFTLFLAEIILKLYRIKVDNPRHTLRDELQGPLTSLCSATGQPRVPVPPAINALVLALQTLVRTDPNQALSKSVETYSENCRDPQDSDFVTETLVSFYMALHCQSNLKGPPPSDYIAVLSNILKDVPQKAELEATWVIPATKVRNNPARVAVQMATASGGAGAADTQDGWYPVCLACLRVVASSYVQGNESHLVFEPGYC